MEETLELVDYISQIKSPFENDESSQEELEFEGYLRYAQDTILKTIGSPDCIKYINLYWTQLNEELTDEEFMQFMNVAISRIVKTYKMSLLSDLLIRDDIPSINPEKKKKLFLFIEHEGWKQYFSRCISPININIIRDNDKLKMFLRSDYESFVTKIQNYKRFNEFIRDYFKYCNEDEGVETLFRILKTDLYGIFIQQNSQTSKSN